MENEPTGGAKPTNEQDRAGDSEIDPENGDAGIRDAGKNGEDGDILGKKQEDLTADDLGGDARSDDDAHG